MTPHGTHSTYVHYRCRCRSCTDANTAAMYQMRQRRVAALQRNPTLAYHGDANTYLNYGCRCRPCTDAHTARCARYRKAHR